MDDKIKILISGGGTGGHIFPAISIANALRSKHPSVEILFVGADNRMEMEKVPAAGYEIIGLPVSGFDRSRLINNVRVAGRLLKSLVKARKIVRDFKPDVAVGVGGYASGPVLWAAASGGIPTVIQEQNCYAGVTNKLLCRRASSVCVAYDGLERFFPADKLVLTGNPVRQDLCNPEITRGEAVRFFGLDPSRKVILIIGGSLGARTINESVLAALPDLPPDIQLIWQTGKNFEQKAGQMMKEKEGVSRQPFIARMDMAYRAADLVISRAGASSISELCLLEKPVILVPSPNVAEDHQTRNAVALEEKGAALIVKDTDTPGKLIGLAVETVRDTALLERLSANIALLAQRDSAFRIAEIILQVVKEKKKK